ncbi:MAG TPA: M48 family metallopeptidase [Desulfomicrobiaceae bacterium]|nr:M48 family metallopeptidase [Desulfomicrobiaceae bacterium]
MFSLLTLILFALITTHLLESALSFLNLKTLSPRLPEEFTSIYSPEEYAKSQEYTRATTRFGLLVSSLDLVLLIGFILLGGFPFLNDLAASFGFGPVITGLVFFALLGVLGEFLSLPQDLYRTFGIEERFGFNKSSLSLFWRDRIKGWLLALALGGPLLGGILSFFSGYGSGAWLPCWGFTAVFLLLIQYLAPRFILPLFNTFAPLEPGELRTSIEAMADRVGFTVQDISVMDGSKRSSKSNAFFTGFGKNKRIALFDTLIDNHTVAELTAVLAHELGHFKHHHVLKSMVLGILKMGVFFFVLGQVLQNEPLFAAFSVQGMPVHVGFVIFGLLLRPVSFLLTPVASIISRRHEFQADRFAARAMGGVEPMISALKTLAKTNLVNLTPHPAYVFVHYSHPPVLERIAALRKEAA